MNKQTALKIKMVIKAINKNSIITRMKMRATESSKKIFCKSIISLIK
jgi:hypothetical protein